MISGGGGGTSSNGGGAKDGARRRCMGRGMSRSLGSWARWACAGRVRPPDPFVKLRETARPIEFRRLVLFDAESSRSELDCAMEYSREAGGAPGQPHSNSWDGGSGSLVGRE